jgi:hypothetical protein
LTRCSSSSSFAVCPPGTTRPFEFRAETLPVTVSVERRVKKRLVTPYSNSLVSAMASSESKRMMRSKFEMPEIFL